MGVGSVGTRIGRAEDWRRRRGGTGRVPVAVAVVLAAVALVPGSAYAERGALTPELSVGPSLSFVAAPPYVSPSDAPVQPPGALGDAGLRLSPMIVAGVRYAFTDDLELGLRLTLGTPATVTHADVENGYLPETHTDGSPKSCAEETPCNSGRLYLTDLLLGAEAVGRLYLAGYDVRFFVEGALGWRRHLATGAALYQTDGNGTPVADYGLGPSVLYDTASDLFTAAAGAGVEYVLDHAAFGLRLDARLSAGRAVLPGAGAVAYVAWSFYP